MREIALDTETTGLDPKSGHRIVEIGAVEMVDKIRTGRNFHCYLNPERDVPEEAFRIHGLSAQFLSAYPVFAEKVAELLDFLADDPLVIHNAAFDLKFLNHELGRLGFSMVAITRAVDTVEMARKKFPGSPANLDALCRRFNIDLTERAKHGALLDAELLADVYLELCGGRQATITFMETAAAAAEVQEHSGMIPIRNFPLSVEEEEAHRGFLSSFKSALWEKFLSPQSA